MLSVKVGGVWLRRIGSYAGVAFSHSWPHGSEDASWSMLPGTTHPALRGRALVEIYDGGLRIWRGRLNEPGSAGQFEATGSYLEASNVLALDSGGTAASTTPDVAIDRAIASGAVSWTRPASLSSVAWGTPQEPMNLLQLLDEAMSGQGMRWYVDADGAVRSAVDPTAPAFHVPQAAAGHGLSLTEDGYFSHLVGYYVSGLDSNGNDVVAVRPPIGDATAAARWGRREGVVDLTAMKVISASTADAEVTGRLALVGGRMQYAESLNLGYGQITTPGGTPVPLAMPRAGQMVRLQGVTDQTWPTGDRPVTDIVIGKSSYRDGDATVQLDPVNKAARDFGAVMRAVRAA